MGLITIGLIIEVVVSLALIFVGVITALFMRRNREN